MAGHSQFKNIMFRKGAQDAKRSKLFSKLGREITVAAKAGLPDPEHNAKLRAALIAARKESMPRDSIERAIKKAQGADADELRRGPLRRPRPRRRRLIVEALTDNRNRTASDVRSLFSKYGGQMGETVAYMFDRLGQIQYPAERRRPPNNARRRDRSWRRRLSVHGPNPRPHLRPRRPQRSRARARKEASARPPAPNSSGARKPASPSKATPPKP